LSGNKYSLENNNLYIIGQDPSVNGVYTCSVRNSVGSLNSENKFLIKVKSKRQSLELKSITNDLIVNEGQQFVLICEFNNYDRIVWYSPGGNQLTNSTRLSISANSTVLIIEQADKSIDEGLFRCVGSRLDKRQQYSIRVQIAYIDEFATHSILALYNQNFKANNEIVVPEHSKFILLCLPPNARPEPKIYWIDPQSKVISNQGIIRILDNHQLLLQNAQLDQSGTYECIAENQAGKRIKKFNIKVQKAPLLANPETELEQIGKEKTNITLDCLEKDTNSLLNSDKAHYSIQWYHNGSLLGTKNDKRKLINNVGQLIINQIHSSDEGLYVCQLNHTGYPLLSNAGINLKVIEMLKFISLPVDRRLELNRPSKIHCRARTSIDASNLNVKWIRGDSELLLKSLSIQDQDQQYFNLNSTLAKQLSELIKINQLNNSSDVKDENGCLMISQMSKNDEGNYTCLAFTNQELIYTTIRLDTFIMPKFIKSLPDQIMKRVDEDLQLECLAIGDPQPTVKFNKDGNEIVNNSRTVLYENGTLIIQSLMEEDSGRYSCLVGNSGGFLSPVETFVIVKSNLRIDSLDLIDEVSLNSRIHRTVIIALGIAVFYISVIVALLVWFRLKRQADRRLIQNEILQGASTSSSSQQSTSNPSSQSNSNQGTKSNSLEKCSLNDQLELKATYNLFNSDLQHTSTYLIDEHDYNVQNSFLETNTIKSNDTFDRKNLNQIMLLGNGSYGNVFLGKTVGLNSIGNMMSNLMTNLNNSNHSGSETMVMIKSLNSQDPKIIEEFNQEIEMLSKLSHEHITKLLAVCLDQEPFLIILEYSNYGCLKQYLLATRLDCNSSVIKPEPLTKVQLLKIAIQVSDAMNYLTTSQFYTHKDLATRNCLISSSLDVKLTFCSLSNDSYSKEYIKFRNRSLPLRWTSSEALFDDEWSKYSDVWSFSVFFWELMFAAELPYPDLRDEEVFNQLKCKQLKLSFNDFDMFSDQLCCLLRQCMNYQPSERPSFTSLHSTIVNELNFITS